MRKITTLFLALTVCLTLSAGDFAKPTKILMLYPEGQGVDKGIVENGKAITLGPGESNGFTKDVQIARRSVRFVIRRPVP